jgi:hypothetical protein
LRRFAAKKVEKESQVYAADNKINKQQKCCSLPKQYIVRRFEQKPQYFSMADA